ncbi:MAG: type II toxin-antitoxin system RelE/ParE family toxin [Planctomycetota bacterium]|nr:type II toxin-antitoxin system RelE/ParE family toxin [Planctomycetota bacterium]
MEFMETPYFTRRIVRLMPDDTYRAMQDVLADRPDAGALIPGAGGLRKLRWRTPGKGKRGGVRVIYYWFAAESLIFLLQVYGKSEREDLSRDELNVLARLAKENA